jgi:alpha-1,3-rhamnosyl/mannosyltransferase
MRVLVNQWLATGSRTGIGHYAAELLRALRSQTGGDQFLAYPPGWLNRLRGLVKSGSATPSTGSGSLLASLRPLGRTLLAAHFRAFCTLRDFDVYHEPNYVPLPCDRPTVATIHDLSLLVHPEWHPAERVAWFTANVPRMLGQCARFLADSEFSRQEAIRVLSLRPEKITTVHVGIRPNLRPLPPTQVAEELQRLGLPPRYLLYVGTIEPRKNLLMLLKTYCALPAQVRSGCPLVLVGRWGWNAGAEADYLQNTARAKGVIHLGYVPEEHLATVYNGARALVYPSLYEGFGLPPLEMMACGGAVLASTTPAVKEVVGSHGRLIDPLDRDGWWEAMLWVITDDDFQQALRRDPTAVARHYTWERCAAETLRVYRSLCANEQIRESTMPRAA